MILLFNVWFAHSYIAQSNRHPKHRAAIKYLTHTRMLLCSSLSLTSLQAYHSRGRLRHYCPSGDCKSTAPVYVATGSSSSVSRLPSRLSKHHTPLRVKNPVITTCRSTRKLLEATSQKQPQ